MIVLFCVMLYAWAEIIGRVNLNQINFTLYFLGVFLAAIVSYRNSSNHSRESDSTSFLWVRSIRRTNHQTVVIALVIFGIIFTTKDKDISRLFVGSFLAAYWLTAIPLNRYVPQWIAKVAFHGDNSIRTVFLGSAKSARRLEHWASKQPFFGIDILGLITYEFVQDIDLKMQILGEFMELAELIESHKVDQVVLLETRNSDWWVDSVMEICSKAGCRILIFNPWEEYFDQELLPVSQGGHTFFTLQQEPLENPINRLVKRTMDICISLPVVLFVLPWMPYSQNHHFATVTRSNVF
ncbi:MAG: hypothetical protein NWT02_01985, partial [Opitutales bacterium]|nr:hypothetical protein [Opitutales bacterium]